MRYRALDSNGDYSFGKNAQGFLTGAAAVAQAITTNLKLLLGEWWEDQSEGLPLFQNVLGATGATENIAAIDLIYQERILNTQGVSKIVSFQSTYENRSYSFTCTVDTQFGQVEVTM